MSRLLRIALPLMLLVAMTGCDAVAPESATADARTQWIQGPTSIPVCSTAVYISSLNSSHVFRVENLKGEAEILSQTVVNGQRRATVGGVYEGTVEVQVIKPSGIVLASKAVTIVPAQTTGGGQTICTY